MPYKLRTTCPAGHDWDEKNTRHRGGARPFRACRKCDALRKLRLREDARRAQVCWECGETGRQKAICQRGQRVRWFCHDEEKSCFNYRRGTYWND